MGLWSWIKRLFGNAGKDSGAPTSLVFLLREPRYLDAAILRQAIQKAFGVDLSDERPDSTEFVAGGDGLPTYFVQFQQRRLLVHNFPMPYFENKEAIAEEIADLRLRQAVLDHQGWLSVDAITPGEREDPYQAIGKLLAELAEEDCLAILAPAMQQMNPWAPELEEKLRGDRPLDAVCEPAQVPVICVPDDDPLMQAAVAEARRRWPEFAAAFERRTPDQVFAVKAPFQEGEEKEYIWLQVGSIERDMIFGTIDNDPVALKKLRAGSRVQVLAAELNDWLYTESQDHRGGFTIEAVRKAAERTSN